MQQHHSEKETHMAAESRGVAGGRMRIESSIRHRLVREKIEDEKTGDRGPRDDAMYRYGIIKALQWVLEEDPEL